MGVGICPTLSTGDFLEPTGNPSGHGDTSELEKDGIKVTPTQLWTQFCST